MVGTTGDIALLPLVGGFFGTAAGLTGSAIVRITYRVYNAAAVGTADFRIAAALTNAQAKAAISAAGGVDVAGANWNGKIPRDSGLARATPAADGTYNAEDLTVVVDGRTLSSADYAYDVNGAFAHLLRITTVSDQNRPNAAANNVVVSYKSSDYDGSVLWGDTIIPTPFGTVTATAGPTFATQQAIPVVAATSLTGFTDDPGTVRIANINLSDVVKITFAYDVVDSATKMATVSTPSAVGAGKARRPTGTESSPNSNTFTLKVALMSVDDINTIDSSVTTTLTLANLFPLLPTTGQLRARVTTIATDATNGLGLATTSLASAFADLLVPIRPGETVSVTYADADAGAGASATLTSTATVDLSPPTIATDRPVDKSFAGAASTLRVTIADSGAGLRLVDVAPNTGCCLQTLPAASGNVVASTTLASAAEYSLSQTAESAAPIPEGKTLMWVGDSSANGNIRDAVGNEPAGSGATLSSDTVAGTRGTSANPFEFTVDKAGPTLTSAVTGGKLDTDPTSATVDEIIADSTARNAITVNLDLGIGGAPVDADTVSPADFEVTTNPTLTVIDVIVGKVPTTALTTQKLLLRLEEDLGTDAKPTVKLVGTLSDQAANPQTNVTLSDDKVVDDLAPVVTASIQGDVSSNAVSRDEVTITATSTEPGTITGTARYVAASGDSTLGENGAPGTIACGKTTCEKALTFTSTGTNAWTSTVKINTITSVTQASGLINIRVTVTDDSGNAGTAGLEDPDGTTLRAAAVIDAKALVFEFDNKLNDGISDVEQIFVLSPETGVAGDHKTDSASPFVTIEFKGEAAEYGITGDGVTIFLGAIIKVDTHSDVDLTSAVMTMPDGTTTQDVLAQFNRSAPNRFVMRAQGLELGAYTLTVQAKDSQGNISAKDVPTGPDKTTTAESFKFTFTVTERAKYTVKLVPGLNLVSVPGTPANTDINTIIGVDDPVDLVTTYDPTAELGPWLVATRNADTGLFEGTLNTIDATHGYWVRASSFFDLTVDLPLAALTGALPPTLPVAEGWNLVPIVDLTQKAFGSEIGPEAYFTGVSWSLAYTFDTIGSAWVRIPFRATGVAAPDDDSATLTDAVQVGRGYWVFATADGTIVP